MLLIKSLYAWIYGITVLILVFPFTVIIWLVTYPFGHSDMAITRMINFQALILSNTIPLWKISVYGRENMVPKQNYIVVSNHQSALDIPFIHKIKLLFKWISKIENFKVPILGQSMAMAKYIKIDRGNIESATALMKDATEILNKGESLAIFPEGTRSKDAEIKRFKTGAFKLAMITGTPILPVVIDGTAAILPKKGIIFSSGHRVTIKILKPVLPEDFGTDNPDILTKNFRALFVDELAKLRNQQ